MLCRASLPLPPPPSDPGDQVTSCPIAVDPAIGQLGFGFGWGLTFWLTRVIGSTSTFLDERFHDSPIHGHQPRRKRHGCGEPLPRGSSNMESSTSVALPSVAPSQLKSTICSWHHRGMSGSSGFLSAELTSHCRILNGGSVLVDRPVRGCHGCGSFCIRAHSTCVAANAEGAGAWCRWQLFRPTGDWAFRRFSITGAKPPGILVSN